jgi:hypothetical protein
MKITVNWDVMPSTLVKHNKCSQEAVIFIVTIAGISNPNYIAMTNQTTE